MKIANDSMNTQENSKREQLVTQTGQAAKATTARTTAAGVLINDGFLLMQG